jgi:putative ABC transport system permease protein
MRLSGRLRSSLIIGGQGIRARKMRTFLSMISLFLGVLAVVVVQAGAQIAEHSLLANEELTSGKDGTMVMYVPPHAGAVPVTLDTVRGRTDAVASTSTSAIIGEPGVTPVNPGGSSFESGGFGPCDGMGNCYGASGPQNDQAGPPKGEAIELQLVGLTGDIRQFRPFRPVSGEWLDFRSGPALSPRIVINKEAAKGFAQHKVPAEMRISGAVANATPRIVGVIDDAGYQPAAYVRADELMTWLPQDKMVDEQRGDGMRVYLAPGSGDLARVLRSRMVALGVDAGALHTDTINSRERGEQVLAIMRWIFLGMAGLVLLIGVAGILNVGLATVGERVEEFALRRAVGTPRSLLAGIVLAETLLTGLFTAALAIAAAAGALRVGQLLFGSQEPMLADLPFPWQAGVAGVVAGLLAGVLGGLIPAVRAARIPIATVMRA